MATSCNWTTNSSSYWPLRTGKKVNAFRLSCRSISSVRSKCSVILRRRKWSWTILYFIQSVLHLVRVTLYRFRIAQRTHRLSDSDRWRDNTVQEVLIPKSAYYIETTKAILNTNDDFPVQIGVQWRERIPYYRYKLLTIDFTRAPKFNRSSDSNRVCWKSELTIHDDTSWELYATN